MHILSSLPPEVQRELHAALLKFLHEIGIQPMVDVETGELRVSVDEIANALGMTTGEVLDQLQHVEGALVTADPSDLRPLN